MVVLQTKIFVNQISRQLTVKIAACKYHHRRHLRHHHHNLVDQLLLLLRACKSTQTVKQIHGQMLIHSIQKPNFMLSKLILLKDFDYSTLFFSSIPNANDYSFNIMIRGLTTTWQKFSLALECYGKMKSLAIKPDNFTFPFVFISCGNLCALKMGKSAHCEVVKSGLCADFHVAHSSITMYSRCGEVGFARKLFDEMPERDLVSWNSMIAGYSRMGFAKEAVKLFGEMREKGLEPGEMALVSVLGACGDLGDLNLGRWIENYVIEKGMEINTYIGSALIDMYGKCGDIASARSVFDGIKTKDVITWNAMITGYAQNGLSDEAISLFNAMKELGINPNQITLIEVLSACASIGALDLGKWIDKYASRRGFKKDVYVATALVDMYAKCGNLDHAFQVFNNMPTKNEVSWNAMISALAFHGRAQEALSLFECMSKEGGVACPNDITFVGLLSACVHVGLVDEGCRLFELMTSSFGLVPKIEHYSCMVDLLSRAGRVYEAWDFIQKMPEKPDEILLGALLGACRKVKNVEIGEWVMELLLEIEPSNSGNYVIPAKIYANIGRWDDYARMRVLMREKGVAKTPGCSWIDLDGQLREFHAGDLEFQDAKIIPEVLDVLYDDMSMEVHIIDIDLL